MDSYRPSSGYYRRALRAAADDRDAATLLDLALALVRETEYLRTWARANGLTPPHFEVLEQEARARGGTIVAVPVAVMHSQIRADGPAFAPLDGRKSQ